MSKQHFDSSTVHTMYTNRLQYKFAGETISIKCERIWHCWVHWWFLFNIWKVRRQSLDTFVAFVWATRAYILSTLDNSKRCDLLKLSYATHSWDTKHKHSSIRILYWGYSGHCELWQTYILIPRPKLDQADNGTL